MVRLVTTSPWLWGLLAAVELGGSFARASTVIQGESFVPGVFLVEYEDGVDVAQETASIEGVAETRMTMDFALFKGASIRFQDTETASTQAASLVDTHQGIKNVWPMRKYSLPAHTIEWTGSDSSNDEAGAARARQSASDTFSTHLMTQVNKLRDEGIDGKGIKLAVIDSGVDYTNEALGGCFGEGCLVSFGYDLVGDDYIGANTPVPDSDPMDCGGHGTHVSGIIAAQSNNPWGILGAATGVTLGMYRVFGCDGEATDDVLISAYNKAYESGADLIHASVGGVSGWPSQPWSVVVSRIVEKGVPCILSTGNDGEDGLFLQSAAAGAKGATAISSFDNSLGVALVRNATFTVAGTGAPTATFEYTAGKPASWGNVTLPLFATSFNTTLATDACDPLPDDTPDLSGYVVLIRRGTCNFAVKYANVAAKGARYVVVYNNVNFGLPSLVATSAPRIRGVGMVAASQGVAWVTALAAGQNVTVSFTDPATTDVFLIEPVNTDTGGAVSAYSTWGPTNELDFKPQFGAPGGSILSTYLTSDGSYAVISGTSMSGPLVAGAYALLMSARGTKDPRTLENLVSATAKAVLFNNGTTSFPFLAPPIQQGAGMVQIYDAARATTLLSTSSLAFNDTDHFVPSREFAIDNDSNDTITYTLGHVSAPTVYTFGADGDRYPAKLPKTLDPGVASAALTFDVASPLVIAAGERRLVNVRCAPPQGLDAARLPVYSGYITINGSDASALALPYVGLAGSLKSTTILDVDATNLTSSLTSSGNASAVAPGRTFLLPPPGRSNDTQFQPNVTDVPQVQFAMLMPTAVMRVDVVPVSVPSGTNITESLGLRTIGDVFMSPFQYLPRTKKGQPNTLNWDGRLATDEYAPEGTYKFVVRTLKMFGDRNNVDDYEVDELVEFGIKYLKNTTVPGLRRRSAYVPVVKRAEIGAGGGGGGRRVTV